MLNVAQLSEKIAGFADGDLSAIDFEGWFRLKSRNVHLWGDEAVREAVFSVESAFSEYYAGGLDDSGLKLELENAIRPFECSADAPVVHWRGKFPDSIGTHDPQSESEPLRVKLKRKRPSPSYSEETLTQTGNSAPLWLVAPAV